MNGDRWNALRARAGSSAETKVFIASAFVGSPSNDAGEAGSTRRGKLSVRAGVAAVKDFK